MANPYLAVFIRIGMTLGLIATTHLKVEATITDPSVIISLNGGNASISWNATVAGPAIIEQSHNLTNWTPITSNNSVGFFSHSVGNLTKSFYRLRTAPVPVITSATTANGTLGVAFSYQITASNNPTSYAASGLPAGLTVNSTSGLISGTPTASSNSTVTISAANAGGLGDAIVILNILDASLITVQGGTIPPGSTLGGTNVATFQIAKYEVTWDEWKDVRGWAVKNGYNDLEGVGRGSAWNHPVREVNWADAVKWCNAKSERDGLVLVYTVNGTVYRDGDLGWDGSIFIEANSNADGYRLPKEAEWEWAARGGVNSLGYIYSGSNDANSVAWYWENSSGAPVNLHNGRGTWPVGKKAANELGLYDMSGNVREFCEELIYTVHRRCRGGSWGGYAEVVNLIDLPFNGDPVFRLDMSQGFRITRSSGKSYPPVVKSAISANSTVGLYFSYQINATNSPTSYAASGLPAGLTLNSTSGLISGSPLASGTPTVTISATNVRGTGSATLRLNIRGASLITVEGGTLPQGSYLAGTNVERFQIAKYEVTWNEWQTVRSWALNKGYSIQVGNATAETHPVSVRWYDAVKWMNARSERDGYKPVYYLNGEIFRTGFGNPTLQSNANGYRLPTEAEWEWAARGGVKSNGYNFSGSNDVNLVAIHWQGIGTAPVGSKASNELGIYDMSGNVWEWCEDLYSVYNDLERVVKGGAWNGDANTLAVAHRDARFPSLPNSPPISDPVYRNIYGFRVVRNIDQWDFYY